MGIFTEKIVLSYKENENSVGDSNKLSLKDMLFVEMWC